VLPPYYPADNGAPPIRARSDLLIAASRAHPTTIRRTRVSGQRTSRHSSRHTKVSTHRRVTVRHDAISGYGLLCIFVSRAGRFYGGAITTTTTTTLRQIRGTVQPASSLGTALCQISHALFGTVPTDYPTDLHLRKHHYAGARRHATDRRTSEPKRRRRSMHGVAHRCWQHTVEGATSSRRGGCDEHGPILWSLFTVRIL